MVDTSPSSSTAPKFLASLVIAVLRFNVTTALAMLFVFCILGEGNGDGVDADVDVDDDNNTFVGRDVVVIEVRNDDDVSCMAETESDD